MKTKAMGITITSWITVLALLLCLRFTDATSQKQATLDQGTVKMLSSILDSLDAFRNDRLRELERIRMSAPAGNGSLVNGSSEVRSDAQLYLAPKNSSVSDSIKALKEEIMGHNPVKKTFGYKVTVYTSPIGEDGKDGKPVVVTQYVGGDMAPDADINRKGDVEDLQESAAHHPVSQLVQSSESVHIPIHAVSDATGVEEDVQSSAKGAASDHNRKTEHSASSDKGHQNSHALHTKLAKGHDHEKHSAKHDEHHKETEKEDHRHDTQAHDKGGASQQGIKERTEIEYYEREHFLDTEYDKAKTGHEKTNGLKEHESHNDHDSHENKKLHAKEDSSGQKVHSGASVDKALGTAVAEGEEIIADGHPLIYTPPYGFHPQERPQHSHADHQDYKEDHQDKKEQHDSSKHHLSEESKGRKEHNSERDLQSEQKDKGYVDKDKGRRKEGYRERGYKITAEREYFLNDAHHDKGVASHTSGSRLKDQEGAAHGSKEGERDRGFVKEEKKEEAHDAAYDTKDRKYFDGEEHKEKIEEEKAKSTSSGQKQQQAEIVPVAPAGVNYVVEPHRHHLPFYLPPPPIAYAPSNDGAQALVALPPDDLKRNRQHPHQQLADSRRVPDRNQQKQKPIGGYDDDYEDVPIEGYVGHAGYRKRPQSALVSSIKENIKNEVHRKPPTYSKPKDASEEENSVRFPDEKPNSEEYDKDSEEESEEVIFPQDDEKSYRSEVKYHRNHDDDHVYPVPKNTREHDLINIRDEHHRQIQREKPHADVPNRNIFQQGNPYPQLLNTRDSQRHQDRSQGVYTPEIQSPDKLLRTIDQNAYPHIQSGKLPTVSEILEEVTRFPQRKANTQYIDAHQKTTENRNPQPELQQFYHIGPQAYQREQRSGIRSNNHQHRKNQHPVLPQHLQGHVGDLTPLLQAPQQQKPLDQHLQQQQRHLEHIQHQHMQHQQQNPRNHHQQMNRGTTQLEQLQQQTKPPFSPVVLLSRGPPPQAQNQAVGVWYTRQ